MTILQDYKLNFNNKLKFNFNGGELTSDSGMIIIEEFVNQIGLRETLERLFIIQNDTANRKHTNSSICFQLILLMVAGYHNQKHVDLLRNDPIFKAIMNGFPLASQSVVSRFMNRLTKDTEKQLESINEVLIDLFYKINPPEQIVFDVDSTEFLTFGEQEDAEYNGHYK